MVEDVCRNLVLVREEGCQSQADLEAIAQRIRTLAPDIEVFIVNNAIANSVTARKAARRPCLVVSFMALRGFRPRRGKVYQGGYIAKPDQVARLAAGGIDVPRAVVLEPDTVLDPAEWGDLVVVKPLARGHSSHGVGVSLRRTEAVHYVAREDYPCDHPGRHGPMMVQRFIDCGRYPSIYRVLTLFGEPLYCFRIDLHTPRPPLDSPDAQLAAGTIASNAGARTRTMVVDQRVLALARRVAAVFPEIPLQGQDIIEQAATGKLFPLEINAGGNTWQFSSDAARAMVEEMGGAHVLIDQLGAFDIAARVLIDKVRAHAQ